MKVWKNAVLGYLGGMAYMTLELLWRGWSHGSMFLLGGVCFLLIGNIHGLFPEMPLIFQSVMGAVVVTVLEFISGVVLNLWLGLRVWDYSYAPFSFMGQVCLGYSFLWFWVSLGAIFLTDGLRRGLFGERRQGYRFL